MLWQRPFFLSPHAMKYILIYTVRRGGCPLAAVEIMTRENISTLIKTEEIRVQGRQNDNNNNSGL